MNKISLQTNLVKKGILTAAMVLVCYYAYRVTENYLYLQHHFFNTSFKDTCKKALSGKIVIQNTTNLQFDTVDLMKENLVLNFSATWCRPCMEELPLVTVLYNSRDVHRYRLYCILQESNDEINGFLAKRKLKVPLYRLTSVLPEPLNHAVYPTTFICRKGKVLVNIQGQLTADDVGMIHTRLATGE